MNFRSWTGLPTGKDEPTIQRHRAPLATATGPDPNGGSGSLDNVAETDFFIARKTRQAHPVGARFVLLLNILSCFAFFHGADLVV
jgi:hypothetical protein